MDTEAVSFQSCPRTLASPVNDPASPIAAAKDLNRSSRAPCPVPYPFPNCVSSSMGC